MDFKERFKGRTSNITKEGVISNLAAPSSAFVAKSTSNALLGLPSSTPNDKPSQCNYFWFSTPLNFLKLPTTPTKSLALEQDLLQSIEPLFLCKLPQIIKSNSPNLIK